ncbi:hypothetical protein ACH49O_21060, partial [Streptomyces coeruleorubidus]|uniref:hypothetical protein n=1 Tax=Streptomyces coeruleorubidus TaxID=116188 RepID=UPI0037B3843B
RPRRAGRDARPAQRRAPVRHAVSGTDPDHRGSRLATRLIRAVAADIRARPHIDLKRVAGALCCS